MSKVYLADKTTLDAVAADVAALQTTVAAIPTSAVKSIQRGVVSFTSAESRNISISTVNPTKCSFRINTVSNVAGFSSNAYVSGLTSCTLSNDKIYLTNEANSGQYYRVTYAWEVIEFN